ncbi:MAG: UbiA family prenyltransferase [Candidatus Altiarchaeota archaeon]|nr:UbiA family prenyltransferase [Candidatus Altiarchaeota archaeon]
MDIDYTPPKALILDDLVKELELEFDSLTSFTKKSLQKKLNVVGKLASIVIHSSLYLGLVACSLMYVTMLLLGIPLSGGLILVFGLISYAVYVFDRVTGFHEDFINHIERAFFIKKHKPFLLASGILSYAFALYLLSHVGISAMLIGSFPFISGLLYGTDWIPKKITRKYGRLKEVFLFKNFFIAVFWTVTLVGLCITYSGIAFDVKVGIVSLFLLVKVFLNTIVFDMRDTEGDKRKNIRTLPVRFGLDSTRKHLMQLNIVFGVLIFLVTVLGFLPKIALFINLITLYTHWYLSQFGKKDLRYLCDVIVEGEDIVMATFATVGLMFV